jgi:hypothetical protein
MLTNVRILIVSAYAQNRYIVRENRHYCAILFLSDHRNHKGNESHLVACLLIQCRCCHNLIVLKLCGKDTKTIMNYEKTTEAWRNTSPCFLLIV